MDICYPTVRAVPPLNSSHIFFLGFLMHFFFIARLVLAGRAECEPQRSVRS